MRYRVCSVFLSVLFLCGSLFVSVQRWQRLENRDFVYDVSGNTVQICAYTGTSENLTIPDTIEGKTVTDIMPRAFYENTQIRCVSLPCGLFRIGDYAFYGCEKLERITFPDSLVTIGSYAFSQCDEIVRITVPKQVDAIEEGAFSGMQALQEAVISAHCRIGEAVFADCPVLHTVSFLGNIREIEKEAFFNDPLLRSVVLPNSVRAVGERAFGYVCGEAIGTYAKAADFSLESQSIQVQRYAEENGF